MGRSRVRSQASTSRGEVEAHDRRRTGIRRPAPRWSRACSRNERKCHATIESLEKARPPRLGVAAAELPRRVRSRRPVRRTRRPRLTRRGRSSATSRSVRGSTTVAGGRPQRVHDPRRLLGPRADRLDLLLVGRAAPSRAATSGRPPTRAGAPVSAARRAARVDLPEPVTAVERRRADGRAGPGEGRRAPGDPRQTAVRRRVAE